MTRLFTFVSRDAEVRFFRERYPDVEFTFLSYAPLSPEVIRLNPKQPDRGLALAVAENRRRPHDGVVNRREKFVIPAARLAALLGVRPLVDNPLVFRDKLRMREALSGRGGRPRCFLLRGSADVRGVPASSYPAVLKPRFGFNSRSVVRVEGPRDLAREYRRHRRFFAALKREDSDNTDFVVEELARGREHTVEAFVVDGRIVASILSDKAAMTPPHFVEIGDTMPTRLDEARRAALISKAAEALRRLGLWNGWAHVEIRLDGLEGTVIEVAARMGGGYHDELIETVYGIDRMRWLIDLYKGCPTPEVPPPRITVVGRRVVTYGVSLVRVGSRLAGQLQTSGATLLWPDELRGASRFVLGPPFGYKNTVLEYLVTDPDAAQAERRACDLEHAADITRFQLPGLVYEAYRRLRPNGTPLDA